MQHQILNLTHHTTRLYEYVSTDLIIFQAASRVHLFHRALFLEHSTLPITMEAPSIPASGVAAQEKFPERFNMEDPVAAMTSYSE